MIYVCNLVELNDHAAALNPERVISIVAPEEQPPTPPGLEPDDHLRVLCHDIVAPCPMAIPPDRSHVQQIIAFARQWDPSHPILIHCQAGISRSTAAALVTYAAHFPETVDQAAAHLRQTGPHARPNPLITELGDELLGMNGRLVAAVHAMGPASAALQGHLVNIPHPAMMGPNAAEVV